MGKKQGKKDIEVNRKTENRTDMMINNVIYDDTIMSKENRKQFGYEICYIYIPTHWGEMLGQCAFEEHDGVKIPDFKGISLDFGKCNIHYKDGASWAGIKTNLKYMYETFIEGGYPGPEERLLRYMKGKSRTEARADTIEN